jgi:hypothetical protein
MRSSDPLTEEGTHNLRSDHSKQRAVASHGQIVLSISNLARRASVLAEDLGLA